jgi:septal ring factor EnvC (AmiA/AmiB activator)
MMRRMIILLSTGSIPLTPSAMRLLPLFALGLAVAVTSCTNPRAEANVAQALNDAANEIGGLKNDVAQLQTDVDSLRAVVAKQDTVINRIAAANNIPR